MNVELLEQVKQHLRANPRRVYLGLWLARAGNWLVDPPPCGTVGCIAGFALFLAGLAQPTESSLPLLEAPPPHFITQAKNVLALPNEKLFFTHSWPPEFKWALWSTVRRSAAYVEVICEAIDSYVATQGWQ